MLHEDVTELTFLSLLRILLMRRFIFSTDVGEYGQRNGKVQTILRIPVQTITDIIVMFRVAVTNAYTVSRLPITDFTRRFINVKHGFVDRNLRPRGSVHYLNAHVPAEPA